MSKYASAQLFKPLRVYKRLTVPLLLNDIFCNRVMKLSFFVDKAPLLYKYSCKLLGKNFINLVISSTYCKIFSAGNTIEEADRASEHFRSQGIPVILDYCAEGDIHSPDLESSLDQNAALFAKSVEQIQHQANQMISIKITGLLDVRVLRKWNESIELRDRFICQISESGNITGSGLLSGLRRMNSQIDEESVKKYLQSIHGYQGQLQTFSIPSLHFKINHHPYYLFDSSKNHNSIITLFFPLEQTDKKKITNFIKRVVYICAPQHNSKNNFRILVDAEQSYVQKAIESISEQLQHQYNQHRAYIIPTVQNYLKRSVQRAQYEILLAKQRKLKFGAKLVRGAYLVQETRLAQQNGYENPVVECFDKTTANYLQNYEAILSNFSEGQVIVATHNQQTVHDVIALKQKYPNSPHVSFAQLLGLADHLTCQLKQDNQRVYKYLPWAQTEVMIPYMIRRGQQLNQMKYPLDVQYDLLKHELWCRLKL